MADDSNTSDTIDDDEVRRMRKYVERNNYKKLRKFLAKKKSRQQRLVDAAIDGSNRTGLHLAAKLGNEDCLEVLLEAGADVYAKDKRGNYPLHLAIKFCLKRDKNFAMKPHLVDPLLDRMRRHCFHQPNDSGTTCNHLLRGLEIKRQLLNGESPNDDSSSSSSSSSDDSWNDKLANLHYEDEMEHSVPEVGGYYANDYRETYDQWADRIYTEYFRRKHASNQPSSTSRAAKAGRDGKPAAPESAFKLRDSPLKLEQPKAVAPPPLAPSVEKYKKLFTATKIRLADLPFDEKTCAQDILDVVLSEEDTKAEASIKSKIREAIRKWHPDKFTQMMGHAIVEKDKEKILSVVTKVSQALLNYGK